MSLRPVADRPAIDPRLAALLERAGDRVLVLAPPVDALVAEGRRQRQRRRTTWLVGAAAALLVLLALDVVMGSPGQQTGSPGDPDVAPDGMRLVGVGRAAIAVPDDWGTNRLRCGTPIADTVVLDIGDTPLCRAARPRDVQSVRVLHGSRPVGFQADGTVGIDGEPAERSATACVGGVCRATVYVLSDRAAFTAEGPTREDVDRLLGRVRVLEHRIAVPGYAGVAARSRGASDDAVYADLRDYGLDPRVVLREDPVAEPGTVLALRPAPGAVVAPGTDVQMVVAAGPQAPGDEVAIGVGAVDPERNYTFLSDADVRDGASLTLPEGSDVWAWADGRRAEGMVARKRGESIVIDFWRNGPNWPTAWEAVLPGRTELTFSITVDGRRVDLGTVTVDIVPADWEWSDRESGDGDRGADRAPPWVRGPTPRDMAVGGVG
ncbi:hypothetical protein EKO23_22145 [Nocardioides guangzhouensis]|uniref:PASTA domain-containing protein n=1 Tax=Nocardioides guangzhouensis TaxID=2497878 RepID=A0A4Q4Z5R0_9ACTN|nr:hypothetical protein [Nocardioides guangzhouensis]RYP82264.1 hypothetical protein EKO23_22145 [Nocardioides guangzhouensis]